MNIIYQGRTKQIEKGLTVKEALEEEIKNNKYEVIGCLYNNDYKNLETPVEEGAKIELIDISSKEGMKIYVRTIVYIMGRAFENLYQREKIMVEYQLGNAMYCKCDNIEITEEFIKNLKDEMQKIIEKDEKITKVEMTRKEAEKFYEENNSSRGRLQFDLEGNEPIYMYFCGKYYNYCYGTLANRTGIIKIFDVIKYGDGFLIRYPSSKEPTKMPEFHETKKLAWALEEFEKIHSVLDVLTVYKLNKAIEEDRIKDVIMLAEALHEKKIANIADDIAKRKNVKMVLIAGPSSSGKTTFAQRLGIQLRLNGLKPVTISVDNYFVERQDTPRDENGEYNFECIEAIDLKLFNEHLVKLLNGEEIEVPEFDFSVGTKRYNGKKMKLADDEILVIEGIHCLNDKLTSQISKDQKYKIYISALTVLNMDRYNRISTTDTRLVRRIVRDYQFRGYSALHTLNTWHKVTEGEEKNIFPYQESANTIFNTSLIYELNALKPIAMPLLEAITDEYKEYAEAQRLINILKYFKVIPKDYVPNNSLLKEFLGGGTFNLH
ncbi:phosphoribulokinase/uridine kinase [Clostridium sp. CAG:389]|nr:phosphoribulokinase/uridine kinase [Clostridium sp. CAG:389]